MELYRKNVSFDEKAIKNLKKTSKKLGYIVEALFCCFLVLFSGDYQKVIKFDARNAYK